MPVTSTLGVKVLSLEISPGGLPQTTTETIANVTGGPVLITSIIGTVETVIQAQANNMKLIANPSTGADTDLCANTDINALAADSLLILTGTLADAMDTGITGAGEGQASSVLVNEGAIDMSCSASSTGDISWIIHYIPLIEGATITSAV